EPERAALGAAVLGGGSPCDAGAVRGTRVVSRSPVTATVRRLQDLHAWLPVEGRVVASLGPRRRFLAVAETGKNGAARHDEPVEILHRGAGRDRHPTPCPPSVRREESRRVKGRRRDV